MITALRDRALEALVGDRRGQHQHHQLARDLAVPPDRISAIVNGKRAITTDTGLRLGTYFKA